MYKDDEDHPRIETDVSSGETQMVWNCWSSISTILYRTEMFRYKFWEDFTSCSPHSFECVNEEEYEDDKHATREQKSDFIPVFTDQMHDMQTQVFDKYYNTWGEEIACGKLTNQKREYHANGEEKIRCNGKRSVKMGISLTQAAKKGKKSRCKYCLAFIDRDEWHTVRRRRNSTNNQWDHTWHYHLNCFQHFSPDERRQLLAICVQSEHISEEAATQLANTIEDIPTRHAMAGNEEG